MRSGNVAGTESTICIRACQLSNRLYITEYKSQITLANASTLNDGFLSLISTTLISKSRFVRVSNVHGESGDVVGEGYFHFRYADVSSGRLGSQFSSTWQMRCCHVQSSLQVHHLYIFLAESIPLRK
jgi:hypothetical protein